MGMVGMLVGIRVGMMVTNRATAAVGSKSKEKMVSIKIDRFQNFTQKNSYKIFTILFSSPKKMPYMKNNLV